MKCLGESHNCIFRIHDPLKQSLYAESLALEFSCGKGWNLAMAWVEETRNVILAPFDFELFSLLGSSHCWHTRLTSTRGYLCF